MPQSFFALLSRMKYISRWALMRNASQENLSEHSLETAILAHALVTLHNTRFAGDGTTKSLSPEKAATLAIFHDAPEVLTGDMPTPVKYHSENLRAAYKQVEQSAGARLLAMLPEDLRETYQPLLSEAASDQELLEYVEAADKLSALIKCIEERKAGSLEFIRAEFKIRRVLKDMRLPALDCFMKEFLPAYEQPLDQLTQEE